MAATMMAASLGVTPTANAEIVDFPAPADGCLDSVAGAVGLMEGVTDPAGGISLDVPGQIVQVLAEWSGEFEAVPPAVDLGLDVTGPGGNQGGTLDAVLTGVDSERVDGVSPPFIWAYRGDATALFGSGEAGTYDIDFVAPPENLPGQNRWWGSAITIVYDTEPCGQVTEFIWKLGADYYYGGAANQPPTTDLIVYALDEPLVDDFEGTIRTTHGGADANALTCRVSILWVAMGTGTAPTIDDELVSEDGVPNPAWGGVEAIVDPFTPGNQNCPPIEVNPPIEDVRGGNVGDEFALIEMDLTIPAGSTWLAFQLESPRDNNGEAGSPESGSWAGAGMLVLDALGENPDIMLEKTVLDGAGGACPGVEGTDELVTTDPGDAVTYCFRVINTGDTSLFPVTLDDPTLGITDADMTVVSGDPTTPLLIGAEMVFSYESTATVDLTNVATVVGIPVDGDAEPIPDLDPVTDTNDAAVAVRVPPENPVPDILLEKTVLAGADGFCPGDEGVDEMVTVAPGGPVTYCFRVINTGETALDPVVIDDETLGIDTGDLTLVSGDDTQPLPVDGELVYSYETTVDEALTNVATVTGDPVDENGERIPDLDPVTDTNDASVDIAESEVQPPTTTAPPTTVAPELPRTGSETTTLFAIGVLTLVGGLALVVAATRRRIV